MSVLLAASKADNLTRLFSLGFGLELLELQTDLAPESAELERVDRRRRIDIGRAWGLYLAVSHGLRLL